MASHGEYWLTVIPDTSKFGKDIEDATRDVKVEPPVKPKVDKAAAEKAGKDTAEQAKVEPSVAPKVDKGKAQQAGKDAAKEVKIEPPVEPKVDTATAEKTGEEAGKSVGKGMAKVGREIAETVSTNVGSEVGRRVTERMSDAIKSGNIGGGASKLGGDIVSGIGAGITKSIGGIVTALSKRFGDAGKDAKASLVGELGDAGDQITSRITPSLARFRSFVDTDVGGALDGVASLVDTKVSTPLGNFQNLLSKTKAVLGDTFDDVPGLGTLQSGLDTVVPLVGGFSSAIEVAKGAQMAFNFALKDNPIGLIVTAIGLAVTGLTWFFTKTEAGKKVWAGLVSGFKATINVIGEVFGHIVSAVGGVVDWIKDHWKLVPIIFGPVGAAVSLILTHWDKIKTGATAVWNWVSDKFTAMVNFVKELPGKIASAAKGLWDGLKNGLKEAFNWIAEKWNAFTDALSFKIPDWVPVVGGKEWHLPKMPTFAGGGQISGPGTGTSDSILSLLSHGEFVVNARDTAANLPLLHMINGGTPLAALLQQLYGGLPRFETGGVVGNARDQVNSLVGIPYKMGGFGMGGIDCSGLVSAVVNTHLGRPMFSSRMATPTEGAWLSSLGAKPGRGGHGDLTVLWWDGGTGGFSNGHTEAILPDGQVIESGGSHGAVAIGAGTTPAGDGQWKQAMHFPKAMLQNPQLPGSGSASAGGAAVGAGASGSGGSGGISIGGTGGGGGGSSRRIGGAGGGSDAGTGVSGGGGGDPMGQLGDILKGGLKETFLGGTGLSDPSEWPNVKSGMALLQFFTGLGKAHAAGAGASGKLNATSGSPALSPGEFNPAIAGGATPGGGFSAGDALSGIAANASPARQPNGAAPAAGSSQPGKGGDTYNITTHESKQTVQKAVTAVKSSNNRARTTVPH